MKATFKTFLEARDDNSAPIKYNPLSADEAISLIKEHCKNSIENIIQNKNLIFRGESRRTATNISDIVTADTNLTTRISENTSNWYTVIFDSSPYMKDFPKRSKSIICTSSLNQADGYGIPFVVVPFDNALIGNANTVDIWDLRINMFSRSIQEMNYIWQRVYRDYVGPEVPKTITVETLKEIDYKLKNMSEGQKEHFDSYISGYIDEYYSADAKEYAKDLREDFLKTVYRWYAPAEHKLTVAKPGEKVNGECWIQGKVVMINYGRGFYNVQRDLKDDNI